MRGPTVLRRGDSQETVGSMSFRSVFCCFDIQGLAGPEGTAPPKLANSRARGQFAPKHTFHKRNQSGPLSTCPVTPGPGTRQQGTACLPQSLLKLFKPAKPSLPFPSHGNHKKRLLSTFLPPPSTPQPRTPLCLPHMAPCGMACGFPLGLVSNRQTPELRFSIHALLLKQRFPE